MRQAIGYTPVLKEPKPSPLRLQAYKDGSPIPGPTTDPDGWKTFPPVDIKGELFKTRKVAATYSVRGVFVSVTGDLLMEESFVMQLSIAAPVSSRLSY